MFLICMTACTDSNSLDFGSTSKSDNQPSPALVQGELDGGALPPMWHQRQKSLLVGSFVRNKAKIQVVCVFRSEPAFPLLILKALHDICSCRVRGVYECDQEAGAGHPGTVKHQN
jgi:hypothetical protein